MFKQGKLSTKETARQKGKPQSFDNLQRLSSGDIHMQSRGSEVSPIGILRLQSTVGNRIVQSLLQRKDAPSSKQNGASLALAGKPTPRKDYVFIMGADKKGFYAAAECYFRAKVPQAAFPPNIRTLDGLLDWVADNVTEPIGNIYIVSHANEDGTLSFGLNSGDKDAHLNVNELKGTLHPGTGKSSTLPKLTNQVDAQTRIHIKGCDLGRTQAMVELIDEAFGGSGTVTAPTHEQVYDFDSTLAGKARTRFRAQVEAKYPLPLEIDPALRGKDRAKAVKERQQALRQRQEAIRKELKERKAEEDRLAEQAGAYEALSGPMFQRKGTTLFKADELIPEINRLYSHLSTKQRESIVKQLIAPDPRPWSVAKKNGTFKQKGQRAYKLEVWYTMGQGYEDPQDREELLKSLPKKPKDFKSTKIQFDRQTKGDKVKITYYVEGVESKSGKIMWWGGDQQGVPREIEIPGDDFVILEAQSRLNNPEKYSFRVERKHTNGRTKITVFAERVVAYVHHGSLDASAHEHFTRPLTDRDFYTTSSFVSPSGKSRKP